MVACPDHQPVTIASSATGHTSHRLPAHSHGFQLMPHLFVHLGERDDHLGPTLDRPRGLVRSHLAKQGRNGHCLHESDRDRESGRLDRHLDLLRLCPGGDVYANLVSGSPPRVSTTARSTLDVDDTCARRRFLRGRFRRRRDLRTLTVGDIFSGTPSKGVHLLPTSTSSSVCDHEYPSPSPPGMPPSPPPPIPTLCIPPFSRMASWSCCIDWLYW